MVEKTKQDLAYLKENPRPISSHKEKEKKDSDSGGYSEDNYENDFDEADEQSDKKLEMLRKAMMREANKA